MRKAIGLGLLGIVGLIACGSTDDGSKSGESGVPATKPPGAVGSTNDPTEPPAATPSTPPPPGEPTPAPEAPPGPIVHGLSITDIAVFQAVKVPIMKAGEIVKSQQRNAQVVANRPGMLRVYVAPEVGWSGRAVTAELRFASGTTHFPVIRDTKTITGTSKDEDASSTFDLVFPADSIPPGATFEVSLSVPDGEDPAKVGTSKARFPQDGTATDIGAQASGKVRIVVVPVEYDADGSGRTPTVSAAQKTLYENTLMKMYPSSAIEVTTHAPLPWNQQISANGSGFSTILRGITDLRQKDNVDKDVYYYGLLEPTATWDAYCGRGCVTGLSTIVDNPETAAMRASVGVGFDGQVAANTMAHEVGHAHGRMHAPCGGPASPDPRFPYQGGGIGVLGYDILTKALVSPTKGTDIMGYCQNVWVSDYTYDALFKRISTLSSSKSTDKSSGPTQPGAYRVATVDESGDLAWDGELEVNEQRDLRGAHLRQATFLAETGSQLVTRKAMFFPFDHLPGGFVFIPKESSIDATRWKAVSIEGFAHALKR